MSSRKDKNIHSAYVEKYEANYYSLYIILFCLNFSAILLVIFVMRLTRKLWSWYIQNFLIKKIREYRTENQQKYIQQTNKQTSLLKMTELKICHRSYGLHLFHNIYAQRIL